VEQSIRKTLISIVVSSVAALASPQAACAEGPHPSPSAASPKLPPDLPRRIQEITDVVLEHHIDPPARQQMILSGLKAMYREAGVAPPAGLGRRVSAVATPEQLAALLGDAWPRTTEEPTASTKLADALLRGLLAAVPGDAELMTSKESKAAEQIAGNRYVGLHITLETDDHEHRPTIGRIVQGGPAERAGLQSGERLEAIDGVETKGMAMREVIDRLRGEEGTDVTIKVRKGSQSRTLKITRGQLPHSPIGGQLPHPAIGGVRKDASGDWQLRLAGPDPIGYLKITEIAPSTPHELRKLARPMESQGIRALVLDLRNSAPGDGSAMRVHSAALLADSLLERGPIGRVRTVRGATTYQADPDALFRGWPIAVLIDFTTSDTAEWIAAALQDNHRAVIVGWPTQGTYLVPSPDGSSREFLKPRLDGGIVRSMVPVGDGRWAVSLVTSELERGDGRPLADRGSTRLEDFPSRKKAMGGVQPDHLISPFRGRFPRRLMPGEEADASGKPGEKAGTSPDPTLVAAVRVLHQTLHSSGT
jgi:carboxyl-terminal processing protease